jgi:putative endonuclease
LESGLEVVARNVIAGGVELDIVARDSRESPPLYIFVEVRSRADARLGHPLETIDANKRKRLIRGASAWLVQASLWERVAVRFDVIALTHDFATPGASESWPLELDDVVWLEGAFDTNA